MLHARLSWTLWAALWCAGAALPHAHRHARAPHDARCPHLTDQLLAKAPRAPAVLEVRVRSMSSDKLANLSVTLEVKKVLRAEAGARAPAAGEHVRVQVARGSCWGAPRVGRLYLVLGERAPAPDRALRLLAPPAPRNRPLVRRLRTLLRSIQAQGAVGLWAGPLPAPPGTEMHAQPGQLVRLPCRTRVRPAPSVAWYKDGRLVLPGPQRSIRLHKNKRRSTLVMDRVRPEDSGRYECRALDGVPGAQGQRGLKGGKGSRSRGPPPRATLWRVTLTVQSETSTYWGSQCPLPDPSSYCLNGGTCHFFETLGEAICRCAEGFQGQRCENKHVSNSSSMYSYSVYCRLGLSTSYYC